ncbi:MULTISPECIES: MerR family transcriptional regulator [Kitasatospora]|uniref:MerR family transcriptional regulator n=1 Tax=Kitasatospora cathayae TaxID=3004092 RepID=A0ABY7Q8R3_9ACTN|nr:MerR family transcriptional regulator [Kitasatospora sp. HUAS 3-15]WBP89002.1 MerR family transcriptional regulator [Kitasatospora sp. HUAS 3-15]
MATPVRAQADLRSCAEVFNRPVGEPDRTPRHTISEVAAASGLTAHTLRWYERIGLLDPVDRAVGGQRRYCDGDLHRLAFLGRLRLTGMSVADMLKYVDMARRGEQTYEERRRLLEAQREEVRQKIADLRSTLAVLDHKIDLYAGKITDATGAPVQCQYYRAEEEQSA